MIYQSTSRSGWLLLLVAAGMLGCIAAPAPGEEGSVETKEALSATGGVCGGPRSLTCRKTEYCLTPANTCPGSDQLGVCRARPQICPNVVIPVCGCDGKTYANACEAARAGASVAHQGACTPPACTSSSDCAAGSFCQKPTGACGGTGTCALEPQLCSDIFNPVCGCDGKTYANACFASAAGAIVASTGACPPVQTCGGIAGIPCPGGGKCVDDPTDDCDPNNGGADCVGICSCIETVLCVQGFHFDSSPQICGCVPDAPVTCGGVTCPRGQVCCNASCGICTPPGVACPQIACL
jgi:hypothetical protein